MKHKTSNGRGLTGVTVLFFMVAALALVWQPWACPIGAQEQSSKAEQAPRSVAPAASPTASEKPSPEAVAPSVTRESKPAVEPAAPAEPKAVSEDKPAAKPAPAAVSEKPSPEPAAPSAPAEPGAEEEKPEPEAETSDSEAAPADELTNQTCLECHNADILKMSKEELSEMVVVEGERKPALPKPPYVAGKLDLSIDEKAYAEGIHVDTTCVTCHKGIAELPHQMPLMKVDCKECHEESVDTIMASAHGIKAGPKAPGCIGCHDVHYGKAVSTYEKEFKRQICVDCHKAYGRDTNKDHRKLYEPNLHLKMACMTCHKGTGPGVHSILPVKTHVARCESCHNKYTVLSTEKKLPSRNFQYMMQTGVYQCRCAEEVRIHGRHEPYSRSRHDSHSGGTRSSGIACVSRRLAHTDQAQRASPFAGRKDSSSSAVGANLALGPGDMYRDAHHYGNPSPLAARSFPAGSNGQ